MGRRRSYAFIREGRLQEASGGRVRCLVCERRCWLVEGALGWCRTRVNDHGKIFSLIYGAVSSLSSNPIEKKPLYHFYPGTRALTVGSWSCNFGCPWCQNWEISKLEPPMGGRFMSPEAFVKEAMRRDCRGTSVSFNEPTLSLEWSLDVFRLARARGLFNTVVTNGYMTAEALELLADAGLDAMNVDIKGDERTVWRFGKGVDVEKVWSRCRQARGLGLHLELTLLLIPGINDSEPFLTGMARRIADELGPETPWHVSGYYPAYRFDSPATPPHSLERARAIGKEAKLCYVYLGNAQGPDYANTYCPQCGNLLIERRGFGVLRCDVADGRCPNCGQIIAGVGWDGCGKMDD